MKARPETGDNGAKIGLFVARTPGYSGRDLGIRRGPGSGWTMANRPGQGRRPLPTAMKVLRGNAGKRPLNEQEPQPRVAMPACPPHLSDEAKREWRRMGRRLAALGLVTEIDR